MQTEHIYESILTKKLVNDFKVLRSHWTCNVQDNAEHWTFLDVFGAEATTYNYMLKRSHDLVFTALNDTITDLLSLYQINCRIIPSHMSSIEFSSFSNGLDYPLAKRPSQIRTLSFICAENGQNILYIFKEFGIGNRLTNKQIDALRKEYKFSDYRYITYIAEKAYTEQINHTEPNEHDPSRGTKSYGFKWFFEHFFDSDEYIKFISYYNQAIQQIHNHFSISIVRGLGKNALHNFRTNVRETIYSFPYINKNITEHLSPSQKAIIDNNFIELGYGDVLYGTSTFAESFITAEWMYNSLYGCDNFDLSTIIMGYYKSLEQFLFSFIMLQLSKNNPEGKPRKLKISNRLVSIEDPKRLLSQKDKVTLNGLVLFWGSWDCHNNTYQKYNCDFLRSDINSDTYEYILRTLSTIAAKRNTYFHKENMINWENLNKLRIDVILIFYLMLGCYKLDAADCHSLGKVSLSPQNNSQKLCEYINKKSIPPCATEEGLVCPVFYIDDRLSKEDALIAEPDTEIEYDPYCQPIYSGIYLHYAPSSGKSHVNAHFSINHLPSKIREGSLIFSKNDPFPPKFSKSLRTIWENNQFIR